MRLTYKNVYIHSTVHVDNSSSENAFLKRLPLYPATPPLTISEFCPRIMLEYPCTHLGRSDGGEISHKLETSELGVGAVRPWEKLDIDTGLTMQTTSSDAHLPICFGYICLILPVLLFPCAFMEYLKSKTTSPSLSHFCECDTSRKGALFICKQILRAYNRDLSTFCILLSWKSGFENIYISRWLPIHSMLKSCSSAAKIRKEKTIYVMMGLYLKIPANTIKITHIKMKKAQEGGNAYGLECVKHKKLNIHIF